MDDLYASLYEHVASGVARVRSGIVRYANPAVAQFADCSVGGYFAHSLLDEMSRAACRGLMRLPLRFEIMAPGAPGRHADHEGCSDHPSDSRSEAVSVVVSAAPWYDDEVLVLFSFRQRRKVTGFPLVRFIEQISSETRRPLEHLIKDLGAACRIGRGAASAARRATINAEALQRKLSKVGDLAGLLRTTGHHTPERVLLHGLVTQAIENTGELARARGITVRVGPVGTAWPAIYGNQAWLTRAVGEYMEHVIQSATPDGEVRISLQVTGTRASIRARAPATAFVTIGLALSQHIVEQHGGTVQIEDEFDATDVVLELPAGAPAIEDTRLALEQAERFERSVGDLRTRAKSGSASMAAATPAPHDHSPTSIQVDLP